MSEPEDHSSTRPISVAELLAKNGSIGSPPVGGRRRRRRGDTDSVTVAELTGEIPIVDESTHFDDLPVDDLPSSDVPVDDLPSSDLQADTAASAAAVNGVADADVAADRDVTADADRDDTVHTELDADEAEYRDHLKRRDVVADPVEFVAPPRRTTPTSTQPAGAAEQMSPDPVADDGDEFDEELIRSLEGREPLPAARDLGSGAVEHGTDEVPSYLRSDSGTLFGGQTVADDLARRGGQPGPEDIDLGTDERSGGGGARTTDSAVLRGVWAVAQSLLAVIFGAVLFVAFELLWKWNNVVALVLAVLVILGLVAGVRVVRKTEDIGSTLIAVAVGVLVTFGPLALLSTH